MPANQFLTFKDVSAFDATDDVVGLVDNIVNVAPELDRVLGRPIPKTYYNARIMTAIGSNASFRSINSGVNLSAPSFDRKRFNCFPFDCQFRVDEAILEEREDEGETPAMVFEAEMTAAVRQKALLCGKQFYQGSLNNPKGPPGLIDFLTTQRTQVDSRNGLKINQVVDAGGVAAGACEIVWFIKMGPQGVHWLFGKGRGIMANPWIPMQVESPDSSPGNKLYQRAWCSNIFGWLGLSMAQYHAVGAIINVNATPTIAAGAITFPAGLTDALVSDLWHLWPITMKPDLCFATQNAIFSLQISRTVTNFVNSTGRKWTEGAAPIADWPTTLPTAGGIPIIATDSIVPGNQYIPN
jgi:hypothetical protein